MTARIGRRRSAWLLASSAIIAAAAAWPATNARQVLLVATVNMRGAVRACG